MSSSPQKYSKVSTTDAEGFEPADPAEAKKEAKIRQVQAALERELARDPTLTTSAGLMQKLTMGWLTPVLKLGVKKSKMDQEDVPALCPTEQSLNIR